MSSTPFYLNLDSYLDDAALTVAVKALAASCPQFVKLHAIGRSHCGRTVWLLEITNWATGDEQVKPGYYIDANIHAEEVCGTSVALYTASHLVSEYGRDQLVTRLMDEQIFYIVPRVNPDGAEIVQTVAFYEWIGNGRYLPGQQQSGPGLHYTDINGDRMILDMRICDSGGEWKVSEKDPRLMVPRRPDESGGLYYRIVPEGLLVDWDGGDFVIPRPRDGNLNRNYPSNWVPESQQYGSGEHPLSEPEIGAVVRWILDHPNIAGMQCYHSHSGVILRPWLTFPDSHFLGEDKLLYQMIGEMGAAETGYPVISVFEDFTPDKSLKRYGSSIDWSFGALGIPTFSTELWDVFRAAGIQRDDYYPLRSFPESDWLKLLRWQDEALGGDGFMAWTPFEHPQLGPVEIGGWQRMFTFRNPPPARYLEEMARSNCRFTLRHAGSAPRLALRSCTATALSDGLWQVTAVIENTGFLPTNLSAQAVAMHAAKPVSVELSGPLMMSFVEGPACVEVGHLAGRMQRHTSYSRFYDLPPAAQVVSWVVRLPMREAATLTVRAGCPRAGAVVAKVEIDSERRNQSIG